MAQYNGRAYVPKSSVVLQAAQLQEWLQWAVKNDGVKLGDALAKTATHFGPEVKQGRAYVSRDEVVVQRGLLSKWSEGLRKGSLGLNEIQAGLEALMPEVTENRGRGNKSLEGIEPDFAPIKKSGRNYIGVHEVVVNKAALKSLAEQLTNGEPTGELCGSVAGILLSWIP
jgi:hypothetical protein